MAIQLPHIEDGNQTTYLPPVGHYETFADDEHYAEKLKEWGLSLTKDEIWYKEKDHKRLVRVAGYQVYGDSDDFNTVIIEFQDGNLSCIHPAYLKEMQSRNFGKGSITVSTTSKKQPDRSAAEKQTKKTASEQPSKQKVKTPALELPAEKVHFTASVKQLAYTWNAFAESNDEVIVLENVILQQEEKPLEVGLAWCSHSKTLKKYELSPGDTLEFDGKIVKKKLPKGKDIEEEYVVTEPVPYKINNPSKIKKG